jgi:hypothetical protein
MNDTSTEPRCLALEIIATLVNIKRSDADQLLLRAGTRRTDWTVPYRYIAVRRRGENSRARRKGHIQACSGTIQSGSKPHASTRRLVLLVFLSSRPISRLDASKADMAGRRVDRLGMSGRGTEALAVIKSA